MSNTTTEILYRHRREWDTEEIVRIGDDYFNRVVNGGREGSRGEHFEGYCYPINMTEARRLLLSWQEDPENVVKILEAK